MSKEVKIGLAIVGVLLLVFGTLLFRRLTASDVAGSTAPDAPAAAAASQPGGKPTVVFAQRDAASESNPAGRDRFGTSNRGDVSSDTGADAPRASFMPAESQPRGSEPPQSDDQETSFAPVRRSPFRAAASEEPPLEANDEANLEAPGKFEEAAESVTALEDVPKRPGRRRVSPVRQTGAELREDEPSGVELAVPLGSNRYADEPQSPQEQFDNEQPIAAANDAAFDREDTFRESAAVVEQPASEPEPQPRYRKSSFEERPLVGSGEPAPPVDGKYTIQPNDSLYLISEKVYGTSGYFKALAEHNRSRLPQIHRLTVGTVISTPPAGELQQKYPALCPKPRKSALVRPQTVQASTRGRTLGGNVYVVEEGDTLFDIARYELGKASRWAEIYELNRDLLGEDFDYLKPGIELAMPPKTTGDAVTRGRDAGFQR